MEIISLISNIVTIISGAITFFQWIIKKVWKNENKRHITNPFLPDLELKGKASGIEKEKKKLFLILCKASLFVFLFSATLSIILYLANSRPPEDEHEAYIWYLENTENGGSSKNLNALGECYFFGRGTEVNFDQAFSYFEKAAPKNSSAQYNLAICYFYGYGTEINDEKAFEYFQKASEDIADAKAYVGYYYYSGWGGVEVDKDKADSLF